VRGVNEALKKYPGIKIAQILNDSGDSNKAFDAVNALLSAKKTKGGRHSLLELPVGPGRRWELCGGIDMNGKVPVVSFDKDPETLDWIDRGAINATVGAKALPYGYYRREILDDLHHSAVHEFKDWRTAPAPPLAVLVDTGTAIIDKSNLAAFREAPRRAPEAPVTNEADTVCLHDISPSDVHADDTEESDSRPRENNKVVRCRAIYILYARRSATTDQWPQDGSTIPSKCTSRRNANA